MRMARVILAAILSVGAALGLIAADAAAQRHQWVTIATGGSGGTFYAVGAGMAQVINRYIPNVSASAEATGGSNENARLLGRRDVEFGIISTDALYFAYTGQREFETALDNLRLVVLGYGAPYHIIVLENSGIERIEDLRGKRIASYPGNTSEFQTPVLLEAYGITRADYVTVPLLPAEQVTALRDGTVDAIITTIGVPNASFSDLATTHNVRFLSVSPDKQQAVSSRHPYYIPGVIPGGSYRGQDEDVPTLDGPVALVTHKDVPEELVYNVLKVLTEHIDELAQIHPSAAEFDVKKMANEPLIPLHPGAERYLRELGIR